MSVYLGVRWISVLTVLLVRQVNDRMVIGVYVINSWVIDPTKVAKSLYNSARETTRRMATSDDHLVDNIRRITHRIT